MAAAPLQALSNDSNGLAEQRATVHEELLRIAALTPKAESQPSLGDSRDVRSTTETFSPKSTPGFGLGVNDAEEQRRRLLASVYTEDESRPVGPRHRLARRPWLAEHFECLPTIITQRSSQLKRQAYQKQLDARIVFLRHLRETFSAEIRAWRRALDPEASFKISPTELRRYCRKMDLHVDLNYLWKALDKDSDGFFRLEELCVHTADHLASFRRWAWETCGSTGSIWDRPEMAAARCSRGGRWASDKKMLVSSLVEALKALKCPLMSDPSARASVVTSLDVFGCGFVSQEDLEWLDKWEPPEWLCAEPDQVAWNEARESMLVEYKHPLRAWRCLLDVDNSNSVSWCEFRDACQRIKFRGNVAGAWRYLDEDLSGCITMKEYDEASAELLGSFKSWAEANFGSVELAFKACDSDGSGSLTMQEMRRSCRQFGWTGEVRLLFDSIVSDGSTAGQPRSISLKDVVFLDSWEDEASPEEQAEEEVIKAALKDVRPGSAPSPVPLARASVGASGAGSARPRSVPMPGKTGARRSLGGCDSTYGQNASIGTVSVNIGEPATSASQPCQDRAGKVSRPSSCGATSKERLRRAYRPPQEKAAQRPLPWLERMQSNAAPKKNMRRGGLAPQLNFQTMARRPARPC